MDLHSSDNLGLYLRQSYLSTNPLNRSALQSRIEYNESQTSFAKVIKLSVILLVALILGFLIIRHFSKDCEITQCHGESKLSFFYNYLEAKLFGKVDLNRCKSKKEEKNEETETHKTHIVTETKTCPLEKDNQKTNDWRSFWKYFQFSNPDCDKLKQHKAELQKIKASVKPFSVPIPDLKDIKEYPLKYARFRRLAEDKLADPLVPEISRLFSQIDNDANQLSQIHEKDITDPDFLTKMTDLDFLLKSQIWAKNLVLSNKNLINKNAIIKNLKHSFEKSSAHRNCTESLNELKRAINIQNQKKDYSLSLLNKYNKEINDLNDQIHYLIGQKSKDSSIPLTELQKIDKEIENLILQKMKLLNIKDEAESSQNKIDQNKLLIDKLKIKILSNKNLISLLESDLIIVSENYKLKNNEYQMLLIELGRLRVRFQMNSQNEKIKRFLGSIIKDNSESHHLVNKMLNENELSKIEMFKVVKSFIATSGESDEDMNYSEEEIQNLIEKDKHEFEEIMKLFKDLKEMIKKFKDVPTDLGASQQTLEAKEKRKKELEKKLNDLKKQIQKDKDKKNELENEFNKFEFLEGINY